MTLRHEMCFINPTWLCRHKHTCRYILQMGMPLSIDNNGLFMSSNSQVHYLHQVTLSALLKSTQMTSCHASPCLQSSGVSIVDLSDDQDSTDLQKCVQHIEEIFIRPSTSDTTKCSSAERPISDAGNASVAGASCADASSAAGAMEPCEHEIIALGRCSHHMHTTSKLWT